ncbi:MAG: WD40 repeat domain-containing protein [Candidatus Riflebacteria bacterium]|nr:WD40 repeat domain-containing protein [Candidatus Riflebacteria bacterium]
MAERRRGLRGWRPRAGLFFKIALVPVGLLWLATLALLAWSWARRPPWGDHLVLTDVWGAGQMKMSEGVQHLFLTRDGRHMVVGTLNTVTLWDLNTQLPIATNRGMCAWNHLLAVSFDGRLSLSAVADGRFELRNLVAGESLGTFGAGRSGVCGATFSPDAKAAWIAHKSGELALWDLARGVVEETRSIEGSGIEMVAFSHDAGRVAALDREGTIRVFDLAARRTLLTLDKLITASRSSSIDLSGDGRRLAICGTGPGCRLVEVDRNVTLPFSPPESIDPSTATLSPDGRLVALGTSGRVVVCETEGGLVRVDVSSPTCIVSSVAFSGDGKRLACNVSPESDGLQLWDLDTRQRVRPAGGGHEAAVSCLAFLPGGTVAVAADDEGVVKLWEARTGRTRLSFARGKGGVCALAVSRDGSRIALARSKGAIAVHRTDDGKPVWTSQVDGPTVHSLDFSPDGTGLVAAAGDRATSLLDARDGHPVWSCGTDNDGAMTACFLAGGDQVARTTKAGLEVLDARTGKRVRQVGVAMGYASQAWFSPDRQTALVPGQESIRLVLLGTGASSVRPRPGFGVHGAAWSPDGRRFILRCEGPGGVQGRLALCDLSSRLPVAFWEAPSLGSWCGLDPTALAVSPAGDRVLAGTRQGAILNLMLERGWRRTSWRYSRGAVPEVGMSRLFELLFWELLPAR